MTPYEAWLVSRQMKLARIRLELLATKLAARGGAK